MSEQAEREIEIVAGTIGGITQKKADTWTVAVTPEGSQYAKNLWTKDVELVESLAAKIGQAGAFVCGASYWTLDGKQVRSLWIQSQEVSEEELVAHATGSAQKPAGSVATPAAAPKAAAKSSGDVDWDAKERRDYRSRAWAQAITASQHTGKSDESADSIYQRVRRLQRNIYLDIVRDLDEDYYPDHDVPFE